MLKHGFQPLKKKKIAIAYFNITSLYRQIKKKKVIVETLDFASKNAHEECCWLKKIFSYLHIVRM